MADQVAGVSDQIRALLLFTTNIHERDAWVLDPHDFARVDIAHHAVLGEMSGLWLNVGADINQDDRAAEGWDGDADSRTNYARQAAHEVLACSHARAGVSSADDYIKAILSLR